VSVLWSARGLHVQGLTEGEPHKEFGLWEFALVSTWMIEERVASAGKNMRRVRA